MQNIEDHEDESEENPTTNSPGMMMIHRRRGGEIDSVPDSKRTKVSEDDQQEEEEMNETIQQPCMLTDIISEILYKLPAELLYHNLRYVCKPWLNLITDPLFVQQNLHCSEPCLIIQEMFKMPETLVVAPRTLLVYFRRGTIVEQDITESIPDGFVVIASCNGLVLLRHRRKVKTVYVANLITKQQMLIRPTSASLSNPAFVFIPSTREYRVVIVDGHGGRGCEILTLGGGCSNDLGWRRVEAPFGIACSRRNQHAPIDVDGVLYWVDQVGYIISFDITAEVFRREPIPWASKRGNLVKIKGCLTFVNPCSETKLEVWMVKDSSAGEWVKQYEMSLSTKNHFLEKPILSFDDGEIIIFEYDERSDLWACFVKLQEWTKILGNKEDLRRRLMFYGPHVSSMVSLKALYGRKETVSNEATNSTSLISL